MKYTLVIVFIFLYSQTYSQVPASYGYYFAKEYSKEIALYKAKDFVMHDVIGCEKEALELLAKIDAVKDQYSDYLRSDLDNNNVFFEYDDMTFLIFIDYSGLTIRVFWNEFDAEWESVAFDRTKKRFEKKVKK